MAILCRCYSAIGAPGAGAREVSINEGCTTNPDPDWTAAPAHEILHAMGRHHEHSRPDRDTYIDVNYGIVDTGELITLYCIMLNNCNTFQRCLLIGGLIYNY